MSIKKIVAAAAVAGGMLAACAVSAGAEADVITVKVDNAAVQFSDQNPIIVGEGYTMVPIRAVFEKAGCGVSWDDATKTATISKLGYVVNITVNNDKMYKNGEEIALDAPAIIENSRILIPVRAIAEAMDYSVTWDGHHSMVLVSTDGKPYRPYAFLKLGFKSLEDAAEFYSSSSASAELDLDNDGVKERIEVNMANDMSALAAPVLKINDLDYSVSLGALSSVYSIAVADLAEADDTKEIVVTENGDVLNAYFYHYKDGVLTPVVESGGKPVTISYAQELLLSGKATDSEQAKGVASGYVLSDLSGTCFVDIMVTGAIYKYSDAGLVLSQMDSIAKIYERNLYRTYMDDKMLYHVIYTDKYTPGAYKDVEGGVIDQEMLNHFRILNGYIERENKKYIELYIELDNGTKAVLKPFGT